MFRVPWLAKLAGSLALGAFALATICAHANSHEYDGLTILFSAGTEAAKDELHKKFGARLHYRSALQSADVVILDDERANHDPVALHAACKRYLESQLVKSCYPNKSFSWNEPVIAGDNSNCPPHEVPIVNGEEIDHLSKPAHAACTPYPMLENSGTLPLPPDEAGKRAENWGMGKLTPFWAQEQVGAFEAQELLDTVGKKKPLRKVKVGVIDGEFDPASMTRLSPDLQECIKKNGDCGVGKTASIAFSEANSSSNARAAGYHGTAASNLIGGDLPYGMSRQAEFSMLATADTSGYTKAFDRFLSADEAHMPEVVNMSMGVPPANQEGMKRLSKKTVVVVAAGNNFPDTIDTAVRKSDGIVVGSTAPNGLMSHFSQEGDEVVISAPSHLQIQTKLPPPPGKLGNFGGTSGATPVVTGAVTNVQSLLPGVTTEELKLLLKGSATPTSGTGDGRGKNGGGVLNEYKLLSIAASLRENWPGNRASLKEPGLYNQTKLAADEAAKADALLKKPDDCVSLKAGLKALRRAFFLDPKNATVRRKLAQIYRDEGYPEQAMFYDDPAKNESNPKVAQLKKDRQFLAALVKGDLAEAKRLLAAGASINAVGGGNFRDNRPIQVVERNKELSSKQKFELIEFLAGAGSTIDPKVGIASCLELNIPGPKTCTDTNKEVALNWAIAKGHASLVPGLLAQGADPNMADSNGPPVMFAVTGGSRDIVKALLDKGANVNTTLPDGTTPLIVAVGNGDYEMVRLLVERGADVNATIRPEGGTPMSLLRIASDGGDAKIVELLKTKGAKL